MDVMLHDSPDAYAQEYLEIRAAFIARGTTLQAWLDARSFDRQLAYRALKGRSFGKKAIQLRRAVLEEVDRLSSAGR